MCGINGIYQFSGLKIKEDVVPKMNASLEHRGPDAKGEFRDDFVHFGHQRLSIIDLDERSNQPFVSEDGKHVLVFNGEIYNYQEIKSKLPNFNFKTNSDTEVVLAAYLEWGENCLRMFNGMFALAVWSQDEKKLFLARDRMGIKPLYYVLTDNELIFSSSVKSILNTGLIERKLRKESVVDYLRFQTVHAPYTLIEGIFQMLPGQQLVISDESGIHYKKYWSTVSDFKRFKGNREEAQELVRNELKKSVERRLVSDVPFGAFLSGGIDSSIIVGLMSEMRDQAVDTFSINFEEDEFSEAKYSQQVADCYKTNHHPITLSANEFKELIPEALSFMDHPSGDGPNTYVVSKKTKEAGVTMALSGLGGDELFGGYSVFNQIPELQKKKWLMSFPVYGRKPFANLYHAFKGTVASSKIKAILKQEYSDTEFIYQFYRQVLMDDQIEKLVKGNLPKNRVFEIGHELIGYGTPGWQLPSLSRISAVEMETYMQNVLLRDSDQMSMGVALELRVPFLDHEFVEQVLGIADQYKRPVSPKKLLVDSFKDMLPTEVYDREKMGFVLPYEHWMKNELHDFCQERLEVLETVPYINQSGVMRLWSHFKSNHKRVTWSRIWPLVVLGDWIKRNEIHV